VYNLSHPITKLAISQLEIESLTIFNSVAFDLRIAQVFIEYVIIFRFNGCIHRKFYVAGRYNVIDGPKSNGYSLVRDNIDRLQEEHNLKRFRSWWAQYDRNNKAYQYSNVNLPVFRYALLNINIIRTGHIKLCRDKYVRSYELVQSGIIGLIICCCLLLLRLSQNVLNSSYIIHGAIM
jgi:hypothetical protein